MARQAAAPLTRRIDPAFPAMADLATAQRERRPRVVPSRAPADSAADLAGENNAVELRGATKVFGQGGAHVVTALNDLSLAIRDNEFFTLLGPSGCGKTTLLRAIAGFEELSAGEIYLFGDPIDHLPPNRRPVNTVFQHYALFPHMTVAQNIAFGLQMQRRERAEIDRVVSEMLALVRLPELALRRPQQLSGGQQQRVALARALATHPKVLLLDEPLSALDLKLRQEMRGELKTLRQETGITFIFVTHDQQEALTMSDRIAVMANGEVQQVGRPDEIYEHPVNRFVADFIGETNLLAATVIERVDGGRALCALGNGERLVVEDGRAPPGAPITLSLRPEKVALRAADHAAAAMHGTIRQLVYLGTDTQYEVDLGAGQMLLARAQNASGARPAFEPGARVGLEVAPGAARVLAD
jgi:spermidine/putrescine transport system ATP-binding protein